MFKVTKGNHMHFNRGEAVNVYITCGNGTFNKNSMFQLKIMEAGNPNNILFNKEFLLDQSTSSPYIPLTATETRFDEFIGSPKNYWYEIEIRESYWDAEYYKDESGNVTGGEWVTSNENEEMTLIGYDEKGPKILTLYPEALESNEGANNNNENEGGSL